MKSLLQLSLRSILFWIGLLNKLRVNVLMLGAASREESNTDPERQIRTRSNKQQNPIDSQPTMTQYHIKNEVEIPVTRQRRGVSNISAKPQQHTRQEQDGLRHELRELNQPKVHSFENQQQQNNALFDSNAMSVVHEEQDSETGHVMKNDQQQHAPLSYKQELDKGDGFVQRENGTIIGAHTMTHTDNLIDQNKTVANEDGVIVQQSVDKDNQQHQSKTGKSNTDCYITPPNQQPLEPHLQEQQYELQKQQEQHQLQKRDWQQPTRKKPQSNEEKRKELQRQQKQRRQCQQQQQRQLDLTSDESDQDNNFDNKFVRIIPESELTEQQVLALRNSGDNFDYDKQTQRRDEQQNVIETQAYETPRSHEAYTEVRSTNNDPPEPKQLYANLENGQLPYEFEQEGLDKPEQQLNNKLHEGNVGPVCDDQETEGITVDYYQQQLHLNYQNAAELHEQEVHERGENDETEIGTEIGETYEAPTQSDTDLLPAMKEDRLTGQSHEAYQQYLNEIYKLYIYSKTFIPLIENFVGVAGSDEHYYIEESLTRTLLELDRIPAENCPELRSHRRQVIKYIYDLLDSLDDRVNQIQ